ncbi:phage tail tape measure protein [Ruminococcus sp. HUN007]|uniref:phage tail tape measure protein n=1 Tax=Ruminococcus sp. HUN007 TaxID=1514668 RepID=UPI0006787242|nr:phage tail tape measure protein [Ruminococcus sp. HUN007]
MARGREIETTISVGGVLDPSLMNAINQAVRSFNQMSAETLEVATASQRLALQMRNEESELNKLRQQYSDYVLEGREGTEEARATAYAIQQLSTDLNENRDRLQAACQAADRLSEEYGEAGRSAGQAENASDELSGSLNEANEAAAQANEGFTVFKATLANLASQAITAAASAIKSFVKDTIQLGAEFDATMSEVQALSGATGEQFELLEQTAREYGATTVFSAKESAEALKYMALAGWDTTQSTSALGGVLDLAAASGMGLGEASDMVTDYLSAFAMEADKAGYFADLLAKAQASSNTSAAQLGEAYRNCAANLNAAGQDIETVTSLLEGMANQGYKGSEAGTALSAMMRDITKKMDDGKIKIGETSIAVMDAEGNYRDLTAILKDVSGAVDGMGSAERAAALSTTFTADSTKGLNLLLNEGIDNIAGYETALRMASVTVEGLDEELQKSGISLDDIRNEFEKAGVSADTFNEILNTSEGSSDLFSEALDEACDAGFRASEVFDSLGISQDELAEAFKNAQGSASAMAETMNDNLAGDLKNLNSAFEELKLKVSDQLEPVLRAGVQFVTNKVIPAVTNIKEYLPEIGIAVTALSGVIAAFRWTAILGHINKVKGALVGIKAAIAAVSAPALAVIGVLTTLAFAFRHLWNTNNEFRENILNTWNSIRSKFDKFGQNITERLNKLGFSFEDIGDVIRTAWQSLCDFLVPVFEEAFKLIDSTVGAALDGILGLVDTFTAIFEGDWSSAWEKIKGVFGGAVDWLTDTTNAFLGWFGSSWDDIWNAVPEPVRNAIDTASGFISEKFTDAKDFVLNEAVPAIRDKWDEISPKVQAAAETASGFLKDKFNTAKTFIADEAVPAITGAWDRMKEKASEIADFIAPYVTVAFDDIKTFVTDTVIPVLTESFGKIKESIGPVIGWIKSDFLPQAKEVFGTITEAVRNAVELIKAVFEALKPTITAVFGGIVAVAVGAWTVIKAAFEPVVHVIGAAFRSAWDIVKAVWSVAGSFFKTIFGNISEVFSGIRALLEGDFAGAWEAVKNIFANNEEFWKTVLEGVMNVFVAIGNFVISVFKGMWEFLTNLFEPISTWLTDKVLMPIANAFTVIWTKISTKVTTVWTKITKTIRTAIATVKAVITYGFEKIRTFISDTWNAIHDKISDRINAVKSTVENVISKVRDIMANIWNAISSKVSDVWNTIHNKISDRINAVKSTVENVISKVRDIMANIWNAISSKVSEVWNGIHDKISEKITAAKDKVSTIFGSIKDTIRDRLQEAKNTVTDTFGNIYDKISEKITAAKDKVQEVIDKIKEKLNFQWSLPHLNLPHISVQGGEAPFGIGGKGSLPKFNIEWYAKGGIMTGPTLFGMNGNTLLAGGEAGAEAILPLDALWSKLDQILRSMSSEVTNNITLLAPAYEYIHSSGQNSLTSQAGRLIGMSGFSLGEMASGGGTTIIYDFSNFTWSPSVAVEGGGADSDKFMDQLRAHEYEFFDWLEEFVRIREESAYA